MNRVLQYLNTAGIVVLIAICLWQWRGLRDDQKQLTALDQAHRELTTKFEEQSLVLKGKAADLEDFRGRLEKSSNDLAETRTQLEKSQLRAERLDQEKTQLLENISIWKAATEQRDARIQEANTRIVELSDRLNESIKKFNGLVTDYNDMVGKLNTANASLTALQNPGSESAPASAAGAPEKPASGNK